MKGKKILENILKISQDNSKFWTKNPSVINYTNKEKGLEMFREEQGGAINLIGEGDNILIGQENGKLGYFIEGHNNSSILNPSELYDRLNEHWNVDMIAEVMNESFTKYVTQNLEKYVDAGLFRWK